jgi:hypothetical protein
MDLLGAKRHYYSGYSNAGQYNCINSATGTITTGNTQTASYYFTPLKTNALTFIIITYCG